MNYKITIYNNQMFREISLEPGLERISIGTYRDCDVRLRQDLLGAQVRIMLEQEKDDWRLSCSDGFYLDAGDIRKLVCTALQSAQELSLIQKGTGSRIFRIGFYPEFERDDRYDRKIDISGLEVLFIGARPEGGTDAGSGPAAKSRILLEGEYARKEKIVLSKAKEGLLLNVINSEYGVFHNGAKISEEAHIRTGDFFFAADVSFCFKRDCLLTSSRAQMRIEGLSFRDEAVGKGYPLFRRKTRLHAVFDETEIEILDPPPLPRRSAENILFRILPSLGMLAAAGIMAMRGSGVMLIFSGISAGIAVFTAVAAFVRGKRTYWAEMTERKEQYERYISEKRKFITAQRILERQTAQYMYRPANTVLSQMIGFSEDLFDRGEGDEDFLSIRLGTGSVRAKKRISWKKQERISMEDDLQLLPEKIAGEYEQIPDCPVICNLTKINALGLTGDDAERESLFLQMVIDIAGRHFYRDVRLIFVAEPKHADRIYGLRMLPHVFLDDTGIRGIVTDEDSRNHVFEYLYKELSQRRQTGRCGYHIVVFFYDDFGFRTHPVSKFVDIAGSLQTTFVFMSADPADLIRGCSSVIEIRKPGVAVLVQAGNRNSRAAFHFRPVDPELVKKAVDAIAPVSVEEVSLENGLGSELTLLALLDAYAAEDVNLKKNWFDSGEVSSLAAPIGITRSGRFCLDIHDSAMGPHGLIAGTTGSGKSELLQTYILSMACRYHPRDVQFLIIDFKGGGMAASLKELPHMVGVITNIDGKETGRSLKSIRAELLKRQELFEEAQVNHIDQYIRRYRQEKAKEPLAHLIIIVDEFAELKAQQPEFMKELISAARIGRSLGVHLILATQKPSGQVDEQIWSNSRFRICLKVQNENDSNEVLRSPLAAQIREPGRAYVQIGSHEIFELFQSAYSSGPVYEEEKGRGAGIYRVSPSGKKTLLYEKAGKPENAKEEETQAKALVRHIRNFCAEEKVPGLREIIQPPLKKLENFPSEKDPAGESGKSGNLWARIGIYDNPDRQFQGEYRVDLSARNLMIIGSGASGKTNILQNIIRSIACRYSSQEVNIYILDYASAQLRGFEALHHVGAVACIGEEDKTGRIFRYFSEQLRKRKREGYTKERAGICPEENTESSIPGSAQESTEDPRMVLIIDNLTALKEIYLKEDEELLHLCSQGLSAGISVVIANQRISGIGYRYLADFGAKISLHCNDSSEYSYLFGRCSLFPSDFPGRCLVEVGKEHYECQAYLSFSDREAGSRRNSEDKNDRQLSISGFITDRNRRNPYRARSIPQLPEILFSKALDNHFESGSGKRFEVYAGLDFLTVEPFVLNLSETGVLGIAGKKNSGRHNWIRHAVNTVRKNKEQDLRIYAVDGITRKLSWLKNHPSTAGYEILAEKAAGIVITIRDLLKERYRIISEGNPEYLREAPLCMLIVDSMDAIVSICENPEGMAAYREITGKYKSMNVCILISCLENAGITYNAPEILKNIRDDRNCLYFDDIRSLKLFDLPASVIRQHIKPVNAGDAYFIRNFDVIKLKTPYYVPETSG